MSFKYWRQEFSEVTRPEPQPEVRGTLTETSDVRIRWCCVNAVSLRPREVYDELGQSLSAEVWQCPICGRVYSLGFTTSSAGNPSSFDVLYDTRRLMDSSLKLQQFGSQTKAYPASSDAAVVRSPHSVVKCARRT